MRAVKSSQAINFVKVKINVQIFRNFRYLYRQKSI